MCYQLFSHSPGLLEIRRQQRSDWRHRGTGPLPTHKQRRQPTISTGTNTTQAPDPALEPYLPPLSNHVLPHTVKNSRRIEWKTQFSPGYLQYSLGVIIT